MAKRQPIQQAPPAQKLRLCYAKRGPARFTSHRDFGRALERALRRARVPMAYSSGFSPHPRISYANAAPTGAASEAEYVELGLAEVCDPEKVMAALNHVLPNGFEITEVALATKTSLGDLLVASDWQIRVADCPADILQRAVAAFLARDEAWVERMTKNGTRSFDVRQAVLSLVIAGDATMIARIRHLVPLVRPDDLMTVLRQAEPEIPATGTLLTRLRQGPLVDGEIHNPLIVKSVEQ